MVYSLGESIEAPSFKSPIGLSTMEIPEFNTKNSEKALINIRPVYTLPFTPEQDLADEVNQLIVDNLLRTPNVLN